MKQFRSCIRPFMLLFLISTINHGFSQTKTKSGIDKIRQLRDEGKIDSALAELDKQIAYFNSIRNFDTLINYYEFVGSKILANNNNKLTLDRTQKFTNQLLEQNQPSLSIKAIMGLAGIYYECGDLQNAYKKTKEAYSYLKNIKNKTETHKLTAELEYDLGYYALQLTDYPLAKSHFLKAIKNLEVTAEIDYPSLQRTYNSLGIVNWTESNMDSTKYYLEKSLKALNKSPKGNDFMNEYYRPALLKMNLAIVSQAIGKNNEAISFTESAIKNFQNFLDHSSDEGRKDKAKRSQLAAIDNLGVFYSEIGEFKRAEELINYSYNMKKKLFDKDDSDIIISKIILAQSKINTKDFANSSLLLDDAIRTLESNSNELIYWKGVAYISRATVFNELKDYENAAKYYEKGEQINREVTNNTFSKETIAEFGVMAIFYAKHGKGEKGLSLAKEIYDYTRNGDFKNSIIELRSIINLAETYYYLEDYESSKFYSDRALQFNIESNENSSNVSDSIVIQFEKPRAITINCKSQYKLQPNKSEAFLSQLLSEIEKGMSILDQRKTVIKTHNDLNILISQNKELIDFSKKIKLELYNITEDIDYINNLVVSHESSMYNRIRSRLNFRENLSFANVPKTILQSEHQLKENISNSLMTNEKENINTFIAASKEWTVFLDSLKVNFPNYYKMRYATLEQSLDNLQKNIPKNTTLIRYLFISDELYAFVIDKAQSSFHKLNSTGLSEHINTLSLDTFNEKSTLETLHSLYTNLWKPFEKNIVSSKVIIIPDGELFNLSFETLTDTKVKSFNELINHSLLAKHIISYNYSLYLLDTSRKTINYNNDFIAFAPEFNSKMKSDYQLAITDSISQDKTYLTLLPQPFTVDLAKEYTKLFHGTSFLNEKASKQVFTQQAKEHKIIHIGTHAESNNISPELSRLIFAKNINDTISSEDNSLYTYEIYNQNLSSNLAILTACETGKPTFQAGEGMISLAHAFNYAGSESILTSLWKIDEQSSAIIIKHFYGYLKKGLPKDEALQKAKLDYMATAEGRTISPQYWAGLVLLGDTAPIELQANSNILYWVIGALVLIALTVFLYKRKTKP